VHQRFSQIIAEVSRCSRQTVPQLILYSLGFWQSIPIKIKLFDLFLAKWQVYLGLIARQMAGLSVAHAAWQKLCVQRHEGETVEYKAR
jgi:hypothetical protein